MKIKNIFIITSLLLLILSLSSCLSSSYDDSTTLTLNVNTNKTTNDGRDFYCVVVQDSGKEYIASNIETVYKKFLKINDNDKFFITPGNLKSEHIFQIKRNKPVSIYFIFSTKTGNSWKYRLNKISDDAIYNIILGKNSITKVEKDTGIF